VGISKAKSEPELRDAIALARQYDTKVIVERAIAGKEFECAVLGNGEPEASMPCEILPSQEFYDYDDKYILDKTDIRLRPSACTQKCGNIRGCRIRSCWTA
jgi:D-alanine-D-alanine ligase